jgi:hypothetical protein
MVGQESLFHIRVLPWCPTSKQDGHNHRQASCLNKLPLRRLPLKLGTTPAMVYQFVENITAHDAECPPGRLQGPNWSLATKWSHPHISMSDALNHRTRMCLQTGVSDIQRPGYCPDRAAKLGGRESIVYLDYIVNNYDR